MDENLQVYKTEPDDCEVESNIKRFQKSRQHLYLLRQIDMFLKFRNFQLRQASGSTINNLLDLRGEPPHLLTDNQIFRTKLALWSLHIYLLYLSLKQMFGGYLSYQYHKSTKYNIDAGGIVLEDGKLDELASLSNLIESLGITFLSTPGAGELTMYCLSLAQISHQVFTLFISVEQSKIRLDSFGFLNDPIGERHRLETELELIVCKLYQSFESVCWNLEEVFDSNHNVSHYLWCEQTGTLHQYCSSSKRIDSPSTFDIDKFKKFIKDLLTWRKSTGDQDFQWPSVATVQFLRFFSKMNFLSILSIKVTYYCFSIGVVTLLLLNEAHEKMNRRLKLMDQNITIIENNLFHLDNYRLTNLTSEDIQLYSAERYSGYIKKIVKLGILTELRYYITWSRALYLCEYFLVIMYSAFIIGHNIYLVITTCLPKIVWLLQIIEQLKDANKLAPLIRCQVSHEQLLFNRLQEDRLKQLYRIVVETYLNYELFRRQNPPHRLFTRLMLIQICAFLFPPLIACYLIINNLSLTYRWLILVLTASAVFGANLPMIFMAYIPRLIFHIMKQLNYLLSQINSFGIGIETTGLDLPMQLWRRQALTDTQCKKFYAVGLLGSYVSYDLIMSMTAYVIAIWLIMLKSS